jgi:hypothetical protein
VLRLIKNPVLIILLIVGTYSTPSQAISCSSWLGSLFQKKANTPHAIHSFAPGSKVRYEVSANQFMDGTVIDHDLKKIQILTSEGKKYELKNKNVSKLTQIESAPESNSVQYQLWKKRERLQTSMEENLWPEIQNSLQSEISNLRKLSKEDRAKYLEKEGEIILSKLKKKHHAEEIGFHYNLHGGNIEDYVDEGGIFISRGDIQLQYGHGDPNYKIYMFRSSNVSLYKVLSEGNPQVMFGNGGRMGNVITIFPLDSPYFKKAIEEKGVLRSGSISFDFDENWVAKQEMGKYKNPFVGIPATEFITPPATVFTETKKKVGMGTLSRDDETLANMRYLERFWNQYDH